MDPALYAVDAELKDGEPVHIRAIRPDDKEGLSESFHEMTGQSVYHRFFEAKTELTEKELTYLTELDFVRHVALVATLPDRRDGKIIGVGRYIIIGEQREERHAEVAFAVLEQYQGRGVAARLLQHLTVIARESGIQMFEADLLTDNQRMLKTFLHSGFKVRTSSSGGIVHACISLTETDSSPGQ